MSNRTIPAVVLLLTAAGRAGQLSDSPPSPQPKEKLQVHLVGSARILADRLRLTPAVPQQAGAAWFAPKRHVAAGFEAEFHFQLTGQGGLGPGADGFAFVLQNQGLNAIAGRGSAGGFALGDGWRDPNTPGIPRSIAVFFDTYYNADGDDPSGNYVAICTNGNIPQMRWPPRRLAVGKKLKFRLKDRRVHLARISYQPPIMAVYLDDGEPSVRAPVDLATVEDAAGFAWAGFTASTGNGWENHDILDWSFTPGDSNVSSDLFLVQSDIQFLRAKCIEGRNLCTPPEAIVEETGPGRYHVILPAQLEWGASIPNPNLRAVRIEHARGMICQAVADREVPDVCSGPEGIHPGSAPRIPAGALLAPEATPGSLIQQTEDGRTRFSVNGRKGPGFARNQGFFEFEANVN
ncbi:MAG: hypothetical protein KGN36_19390 [Acidobacteriota bacterium]|nr:hypothetical protein [Acidobacteriota bacterium]